MSEDNGPANLWLAEQKERYLLEQDRGVSAEILERQLGPTMSEAQVDHFLGLNDSPKTGTKPEHRRLDYYLTKEEWKIYESFREYGEYWPEERKEKAREIIREGYRRMQSDSDRKN
jgi:hypothetical protein